MAVGYASGSAGNPPPELSKREFANTQADMPRAWAEEAAETRYASDVHGLRSPDEHQQGAAASYNSYYARWQIP